MEDTSTSKHGRWQSVRAVRYLVLVSFLIAALSGAYPFTYLISLLRGKKQKLLTEIRPSLE